MDNLPSEFDLIVIGTGLVESIISAAASRVDKRVLQIDSRDYYGGTWASFNLNTIQDLLQQKQSKNYNKKENEVLLGNDLFGLIQVEQNWYIPEDIELPQVDKLKLDEDDKADSINKTETQDAKPEVIWTQKKLLKDFRKFNIDLAPKIQFARGEFVELLISSNIARYSEYRSVSRVLTYINGNLETVPCSRSDIFADKKVSVIEKRLLMKLLTACMEEDTQEFNNYAEKPFKSYLKDKKLSNDLIHYVLYAIAMCTDETNCFDGVAGVKRFLNSLGRFGKTPFLFSMYGSGEIPQAFCRMSAVFGGVFALNQPLYALNLDDDMKINGIVCGEQVIRAPDIVAGVQYIPKEYCKNDTSKLRYISRGIFITDQSLQESEQEHLTLLLIPSTDGKQLCYVLEAGSTTGTVPKDLYITYMFTRLNKSAKEDLTEYAGKLFTTEDDSSKPRLLWSFYYATFDGYDVDHNSLECPENLFACTGPDMDLDYDNSIKKARAIFEKLYPGEELLPRAPDPEEIIFNFEEDEEVKYKETVKNIKSTEEKEENEPNIAENK